MNTFNLIAFLLISWFIKFRNTILNYVNDLAGKRQSPSNNLWIVHKATIIITSYNEIKIS